MLVISKRWGWVGAVVVGLGVLSWRIFPSGETIDFNTQVKPIFNKKCIACHGGVRRQSDFSLLFRVDALGKTKSGKPAIVPGDPEHSEMMRRITLHDPEDRMPYKQAPLSGEEIETLRKWIRQGAKWGDHWAYLPVRPVGVPALKASFWGLGSAGGKDWVRSPIDYFIYEKLRDIRLSPSKEADKATLLRRVSLDLTGLPPSAGLVRQFFSDSSAGAYERVIDTLLASPHYGERWAAVWLDLARYADTKGYERDDGRSIWRYRDWLIHSFNADMPYNRFLTEQLAGDLLPNPTDDEFIATAFHRNTMTNDEGGTDNEEFRTAAVLDRVNTTWQALMGTTFACVQCHTHPYDPFVHDEYYKFSAFFNDTRDEDTYADYPLLRKFSGEDSLGVLRLVDWVRGRAGEQQAMEVRRFLRTWEPAINSLTADHFVNAELADTKWLIFRNHGSARLQRVDLGGRDQLIYRYSGLVGGGTWTMHLDGANGPVIGRVRADTTKGWKIAKVDLPGVKGVHDIYLTYENPRLKKPGESGLQFDWFYFGRKLPVGDGRMGGTDDRRETAAMEQLYWRLINTHVPTVPVMMDNPADLHRETHVFEKGNWLVKGALVEPATPHALNSWPAGAPKNRLGLARWLTSPDNPLVARTMVNRLWEQLFGTGLVETLEDLGTQGAVPTHRELLDWLSWRLMHEDGWSVKKLLREMVLSATYRQDSKVSVEALTKDPDDRYYSRAPRVRLSAEQVRDQALAVSGLLDEELGGPSVMPWQPKGIWLSPWNGQDWATDSGRNQYRRAIYTYWKRTAPYPSMISFDGTAREVCTARRIRTNTPLQALVLLNDSVYWEAAGHLANIMMKAPSGAEGMRTGGPAFCGVPEEGAECVAAAIRRGYRAIMLKPLPAEKLKPLMALYGKAQGARQGSQRQPGAASDSGGRAGYSGEPGPEAAGSANGLARRPQGDALTVVASALLNLDEVVTKN